MAQVLNAPLPQHKTFRLGMQPQVWKCGNSSCKNLVSDVYRKSSFRKYCSVLCRDKVNQEKRKQRKQRKQILRIIPSKPCEYCKKIFTPKKKSTTRFCCKRCNFRALRGVVIHKQCDQCKKTIESLSNRKYCSKRCKLIHYHLDKLKELGIP